jgi:hypothetical protein
MSSINEVTYTFAFGGGKRLKGLPSSAERTANPISRVARLMALALRFEGLVREETVRDYAELARRGHVTRARMTQIMKLLNLAPDIQEQILFLPPVDGLNERNLRPIVRLIDWDKQRSLFHKLILPPRATESE